ncbi:MAG: isopentenyl phosphate kinase [Methanobacteriaceae archaeon]
MIILKLGGSILTKKDSEHPELDYNNLNRIASEISSYYNSNKISNLNGYNDINNFKGLVIVHGAGSFGHPPAKKYNIGTKFEESEYPKKRIGFSITQNCVKKLNTEVCDVLVKNNIPAVSIQASSFITTKNKRIDEDTVNLDLIKKYLTNGFVPVIYGDVVLDSELKIAVLSGDQIITYLAKNLNPKRVILGTDVDGVYNKNPKSSDSNAELIEVLSSLNQLESFDSTNNIDVTGGMVGKIKELLDLAEIGIESNIINANTNGIIYSGLNGDEVKGTLIKLD